MDIVLPQVIPYQGSKRKLVNEILSYFPKDKINTLYEPFCGSAAVSLNALNRNLVKNIWISDKLNPLMELWEKIVFSPEIISNEYKNIWEGQFNIDSIGHYNMIREQYNDDGDPSKLLYLICRCVKNAIRFNDRGEFNQSPDKRRSGKNPMKLRKEIQMYSVLMKGKSTVSTSDFYDLLDRFTADDLIYLDPPYQGTSTKKDSRYAFKLDFKKFTDALNYLNSRDMKFIVSFDGNLDGKIYGEELGEYVDVKKKDIIVGRSSQATLLGRDSITTESLYISPSLFR